MCAVRTVTPKLRIVGLREDYPKIFKNCNSFNCNSDDLWPLIEFCLVIRQ